MTQLLEETEVRRLRHQLAATQRELDAYRDRLQRELELAATVHRSLLPQPVHDPRIHVDVRYMPIEQVGGDYCQVGFSDRDTCSITICDVTGHGIGPALLATRVSSEVRYGILYGRKPAEIIQSLNQFVYAHFGQAELYLSFVAAQIDLRRRRIAWCGAGHPSPLLVRRASAGVEELRSQNLLVGVSREVLLEQPEDSLDLEPGDRLLFYTDGVTETTGADGKSLGTAGLGRIAVEGLSVDLFAAADYTLEEVARQNCDPVVDDRTLIVAELQ